jgi:AcrR family transcriptional regulator
MINDSIPQMQMGSVTGAFWRPTNDRPGRLARHPASRVSIVCFVNTVDRHDIAPQKEPDDKPLDKLPRGRHGLPREVITESQRTRILDGMVQVVAERGYLDATIADVIGVAGVSRKTFYELFEDKEDCFLVAYDEWLGVLVERTAEAYESKSDAPWAERLRLGFAALLETLARNPAVARFCIVEALGAGPKALVRRDAAMRELTHFVDAGRAETSFELPGITSLTLIGGVEELLYSEIIHGTTAQLPGRLPDIVFCLTYPFLGAEQASAERDRARQMIRERSATVRAAEATEARQAGAAAETAGEGNAADEGNGSVSDESSAAQEAARPTQAG